jgi:hypothetical protein
MHLHVLVPNPLNVRAQLFVTLNASWASLWLTLTGLVFVVRRRGNVLKLLAHRLDPVGFSLLGVRR